MKVTIRKEGLTVTIEAEEIPQEVLERLMKAVYGSPEILNKFIKSTYRSPEQITVAVFADSPPSAVRFSDLALQFDDTKNSPGGMYS